MSDLAIQVSNLSKKYQLGTINTGTLSRDLNKWWSSIRGKGDPYALVGQVNDRTNKAEGDFVWSLKDIDFEIKKGDAVGIIGRNGAGKSTLLKILSRVTSPTTGEIKIGGRVASLLEVGTGFHAELTGRENIYMNGAILGMSRREITSKLDNIVDFSGVEMYIDTPVKRYSSGMYVRLAFAVAAHLEPEILIVDEVLAVGDAEFQKKCLGKMQDVNSKEGRTVLFVSHNMGAITSLCNIGIILTNGMLTFNGSIEAAVHNYLTARKVSKEKSIHLGPLNYDVTKNKKAKIVSVKLQENSIKYLDPIEIEITIESGVKLSDLVVGIGINTTTAIRLITVENLENLIPNIEANVLFHTKVIIPITHLAPGDYTISAGIRQLTDNTALDYVPDVLIFEVESTPNTLTIANNPHLGLRPKSTWLY